MNEEKQKKLEQEEFALPDELLRYLSHPVVVKIPPPQILAQRAVHFGDRRTIRRWEIGIIPVAAALTAIAILDMFYSWWSKLSFTIQIPFNSVLELWARIEMFPMAIWVVVGIIILLTVPMSRFLFRKK